LWRWIGEHLGIRGLDAGQVENLTLEDFVSGAVADLLSGEEIASSQRREDDNDTHFQFTGESEGDSRDVRDGGFPADDAPGGVEVAPPAIRPGEGLLEYAGRVSAWWNGNGRDMDGLTRELNEAKAKVFGLRRERDRIARSLKGIRETSAGKTEKLNRIKEAARELEEYIAENINSEIVDWMGVGEFRGLMARLRNPTSGKDVDAAIMAIDKTVNNIEVRRYGATLEALLKTKVLDRNQRGVSVAKNVDDDTRRSVEYLRSNRNLSEEEIDERVRAVNERMETGDVSDDVRRELSDLETVRRLAFINRVKNNIHAIDEDIRRAKEAWTDATVQSLNRERLGYQRDLIDAYDLAVREVSGLINTGRSRLADIVRKDIERRRKIAREAIEAVKYKPVLSQAEEKEKEKNRKLWDRIKDFTQENGVKEFFLAPQGNFDFMLKYIDYNHPMGEGRLYKRFMKSDEGVFAANDNFYRGLKEFRGAVRDKAEEIFGLDFGDVLADSRRHSGMSLEYMDRKENVNVIRMTYGELLYVYSVSKMTDGHAKLERMGIDDEAIERIRETLGEKYVRFSDWVQGEFLPGRRKV
jgi:hypothetical protein